VINSAIAAAPTSGRLQRFFGVSRLKIDPQLIGIDNTPQARLSVEQQLSRNVSLSYVTSLSRAQQQIVRVQWDLTRQWSAIATRDENGVLSIDFVFRRSFR
jgi:translocation and assembly module TamB